MEATYEYKPTTALWKIEKLVNSVDDLAIIQGGGGAGKTIGIEMLIIDWFNRNADKQVTICSHERTKLMDTAFHDFKKIAIDWGLWHLGRWNENKSRFTFNHSNTGFIEFIGLDKADIGKGRRRDLIYINEANKITHEKYVDISLRARKVIVDYNSDAEFWAHDYATNDNFISLTFEDNEFIPEEERRNLLEYKEKAFHNPELDDPFQDKNIKSKFFANKWKVYGLGLTGGSEGQIFTNWKKGEFNDNLPYGYGIDWGYTDPFTLTKVAVDDKKKIIYVKQIIYARGLKPSQINKAVTHNTHLDDLKVCDNAQPGSIVELRDLNHNAIKCIKPPISQSIGWMQDYIWILEDSPDGEKELNNYIWADKKSETPIDKHNHLIDSVRYYFIWWWFNVRG